MCKHILNAQVSVRAPCCKKFFDCPECHEEVSDHPLRRSAEVTMVCKKCRKAFRKDTSDELDESDEHCPNCDNHYVITAKTPQAMIGIEGGDARVDNSMLRETDVRVDQKKEYQRAGSGVRGLFGGDGKDYSADLELREKGQRGLAS